MSPGDQRPAARLTVAVQTPDGGDPPTRGLGPWLARTAPARARGQVALALVSDRRMRALNRMYRGQDYATDVLSFPVAPDSRLPTPDSRRRQFLGDIVIALGVANRQARERRHDLKTELRVLALHGLLHLLGYDHEQDAGEMARVEARLRKKGGLREGLIERGAGAGRPARTR